MRSYFNSKRLLVLFSSVLLITGFAVAADGPYRLVKEIQVGAEGGWDYASVDSTAHRLYVSHGTKVVVIDIDKNEVVGEVNDTPGVHGFAFAPELGLGFSSNGRENKVSVVELITLRTLSKLDTGQNPDAIYYVPETKEVYTFNGRSNDATVLEARDGGKLIATIPLPGKPEFATYDPATGRIYNNIEDKSVVVAIDVKTHKVVETWPIAPGEEASGMAIDTRNHRLFIVCSNRLMVVMDYMTGKVVTTVPIGPGVDAACFDPVTSLAFASNGGDGTVTVAHLDSPDKLTVVQTLRTQRGSRTMTLDPRSHRIYLAAVNYEAPAAAPVEAPGAKQPRPKPVPDSFKVLVYGHEEYEK
jgi:DNA-binding beta-propeller fold protein YncE